MLEIRLTYEIILYRWMTHHYFNIYIYSIYIDDLLIQWLLVHDQQECNPSSSWDVDECLTCTKECPNRLSGHILLKLKLKRKDLRKKRSLEKKRHTALMVMGDYLSFLKCNVSSSVLMTLSLCLIVHYCL